MRRALVVALALLGCTTPADRGEPTQFRLIQLGPNRDTVHVWEGGSECGLYDDGRRGVLYGGTTGHLAEVGVASGTLICEGYRPASSTGRTDEG